MDKTKAIKKVKQKKEPSKYKQYLEEASDDRQYYMELMKKSDAFKAINPRQRLFCINYVLTGGNASQASVLSG